MARHKEFNQEKIVDKAMDLFWRQGYEATSIQALVDHLGIGRGSIYDTFGSKHGLYLAALDQYQKKQGRHSFAPLAQDLPPKEAIAQVFKNLVDEALQDPDRCGCFIVNSAVELAAHDLDIESRAKQAITEMEAVLFAYLSDASAQGDLPDNRDWRIVARLLVNSILGIRVMAKINPDREILSDTVSATMTLLD